MDCNVQFKHAKKAWFCIVSYPVQTNTSSTFLHLSLYPDVSLWCKRCRLNPKTAPITRKTFHHDNSSNISLVNVRTVFISSALLKRSAPIISGHMQRPPQQIGGNCTTLLTPFKNIGGGNYLGVTLLMFKCWVAAIHSSILLNSGTARNHRAE